MDLGQGERRASPRIASPALQPLESVLVEVRTLLERNRRLKSQLKLFDALAHGSDLVRTRHSLVHDVTVCKSTSRRRSDNAGRAVHERAKALQQTLRGISERYGDRLGYRFDVAWSEDEGAFKEYRLVLEPWVSSGEGEARAWRSVCDEAARFCALVDALGTDHGRPHPSLVDALASLAKNLTQHLENVRRTK
jgi:hypothetical protein